MVAIFSPAFDDSRVDGKDGEIFEKVIVPLRLELLRMALKITGKDRHEAEDLLHDSLLKALSQISSLADEKSARAWIYMIMRNTYISNIRKQRHFEPIPGNEIHRVIDLIRHTNGTMTKVSVRMAVEKLDEKFREPVILCDVQGYSYKEAAKEIGCPLGTLMSRLFRGREKLRDMLKT